MISIISCSICGGLGNQLFQIFATIAYGMRTGRTVIFPYSKQLPNNTTRYTFWDTFLQNIRYMTVINPNNKYTNNTLSMFPRYIEQGFSFNKIPDMLNSNIILQGYFQSPLYFIDEYEYIRSMIKIDEIQNNVLREFTKDYFHDTIDEYISIHFRMGDYKNHPTIHPILSYDYYEKAMFSLLSKIYKDNRKYKVLYFCEKEDNTFIEANYINKLRKIYDYIDFQKVDDSIEDWKQMILMSCCNHHIIANSTFSWWGAFLNKKPDKLVCYPDKWFGIDMSHYNINDLFVGNDNMRIDAN
jgi:hypothetical protein